MKKSRRKLYFDISIASLWYHVAKCNIHSYIFRIIGNEIMTVA